METRRLTHGRCSGTADAFRGAAEVRTMTHKQAAEHAQRLGLSAWIAQAVTAGPDDQENLIELKCVGFASANLALAEKETWGEALDQAARIIFSP